MRLTPLDIRKQEFGRSLRGLNPEEVSSFLQLVSNQWDELLSEQRQLEQRVRELEAKLEHYSNVEEALQEALRTARESSKQALESARQQALGIIREAERRSDEMKRSAEQERIGLRKEANDALMRRNEIAARLRAFLQSELELLARFEADFPAPGVASPLSVRSGDLREDQFELASTEHRKHAEYENFRNADASEPVELEESADSGEAWPSPKDGAESDPRVEAATEGGRPNEQAPPQPVFRDEPRPGSSFVVRPVFGASTSAPAPSSPDPKSEQAPAEEQKDGYEMSASVDEIERIRRILKDLE